MRPRLVPVRHLSLDLAKPINGWEADLLERGVEIVEDDLGQQGVSTCQESEHRSRLASRWIQSVGDGLFRGEEAVVHVMGRDRGRGTPPSITRLLDAETAVKHLPG